MTLARSLAIAMGLGIVVTVPTSAQDHGATARRSIATLAQVPLKSRNGTPVLLGSRVRPGKPTVISIWASWCLPCVAEAPYLARMRKDLGSGYNFVYVNRSEGDPDRDQPAEAVAQFLARAGMSDVDYVTADISAYRQILGADIADIPEGKVGVPRVYLFDRNGRQIYTAYGFGGADDADLERRVKQAMAK